MVPDGQDLVAPPPTLSVIVAHLNQPDTLHILLDSLMTGHRKPLEVIVVDNGSVPPPDAVCARYPLVRLLHEPAPGPGPARSLGARAARGAILAFTDADCRADAGWAAAIEAAFRTPDATILGGAVRVDPANPARPTMAEAYEAVFSYRARDYIRHHGFALTCNLAVKADVFRAVGDFAGRDRAEDVDWGRRATGLGYRITFCPDMVIHHPARASIAALRAKWTRQTAHAFAAVGPRLGRRTVWALRALAMGPSPLLSLPRLALTRRIHGPRARALAFAALCLIRLHRAQVMLRLLAGGDPVALVARWNRGQGRG